MSSDDIRWHQMTASVNKIYVCQYNSTWLFIFVLIEFEFNWIWNLPLKIDVYKIENTRQVAKEQKIDKIPNKMNPIY